MSGSLESQLHPLLDAAFGAALNLTRHRADAEDLLQDAVLNACRGFSQFQPGTNFKAWFFRILYNAFLARHRKLKPERGSVGLDDAIELALIDGSDASERRPIAHDTWRAALSSMRTGQVMTAIQNLPDDYRAVATMYFVEDFSYQEIADMLRIPVGTVRSRLHRGRKLLQQRLLALAVDEGIVTVSTPRADRARADAYDTIGSP
ncbi:MAG: sigma-70 family RNA polymerase sigma factor [Gemmatimonadota bacterium]|nr:sigma-70 family RNA polymerase sigma factor [Gemmatimonadota bacterium]